MWKKGFAFYKEHLCILTPCYHSINNQSFKFHYVYMSYPSFHIEYFKNINESKRINKTSSRFFYRIKTEKIDYTLSYKFENKNERIAKPK